MYIALYECKYRLLICCFFKKTAYVKSVISVPIIFLTSLNRRFVASKIAIIYVNKKVKWKNRRNTIKV